MRPSPSTRLMAMLGFGVMLFACGPRRADDGEGEASGGAALPKGGGPVASRVLAPPIAAAPAPAATATATAALATTYPVELPKLPEVIGDAVFAFSIRGDGERVFFSNAPTLAALRADSDWRVRAVLKDAEAEGGSIEFVGEADPRRSSNHLIGDLFDRVLDGTDLEKQVAAELDRAPLLVASLALDVATPMGVVIDIMVTAGRGEVDSYVAEVETPAGVRHVAFAPDDGSCGDVAGEVECVSPTVFVGRDGVFVGLIGGSTPFVCDGRSRRRADRALLSAADGGCPSVRSDVAVAGVEQLLSDLRGRTELCDTVYFGAEPGVRWGDLVPHFATVLPHASIKVAAEPLVSLNCEEAASAEEIERFLAKRGDRGDTPPPGGGSTPAPVEPPEAQVKAQAQVKATYSTSLRVERGKADVIRRINRAHDPELGHCHRQLEAVVRARTGAVTIAYQIDETGKTRDIVAESDSLGDPNFATCVQRSVRRWKYPRESPAAVWFTVKSSPTR